MNGNILYLSPTYPGSVHDKTLCEEEKFSFSKKVLLWLDLGFYGWKIENVHLIMPHKKPKGGELTDEQKEYNRDHHQGSYIYCRCPFWQYAKQSFFPDFPVTGFVH